MKKLMIMSLLMIPLAFFGQTKTLEIENLMVEKDGVAQEVDKTQSFELQKEDRKPYFIFEKDGQRIGFYLNYTIKGERVKLSRQVFILTPGGEEIKGKRRKDVIFLKTGHQDAMSTKVAENLMTSKENLTTYFISFDYKFLYK